MRTRERFGDFLLLKKLSEDPLGEVFRAGRLAGDGVDQVLLLRVFNGSAVQGISLQASLQRRKPLQQLLRSPNLAQGVDAGEFQGVPYVTYDYVSGKDLATLMEQAVRRASPVPSEHALLIVDRLALGLTVAHGARLESQRVSHGFLVPQLVMLSNEGENRLLGFEVSEGLRAAARPQTPLGDRFGRYLSPEALQGRPLTSTDDVYSLGVILLELLVGRPLPHPAAGGPSAEIERVASLGFPKIASLIERSLAPAAQRIGDVVTWHKTLDQLVRESNTSSTPFHLAFYMHNLFREDIERETAEIQTEKTMDFSKEDLRRLLQPDQPAPPAAPVAPPPFADSTVPAGTPPPAAKPPSAAAPPIAPPPKGAPPPDAKKTPSPATVPPAAAPAVVVPPAKAAASAPEERSKAPLLLVAALLLLLAGGGGFYAWWALRGPGAQGRDGAAAAGVDLLHVFDERALDAARAAESAAESAAAAEQAATEVVAERAPPPGPSREELVAQIDAAVSSRTKAVEATLRDQYDKELQALRDQLATAEQQRQEREVALREAQRRAAEATAAESAKAEDVAATDSAQPAAGGNADQRTTTGTPAPATGQPTTAAPASSSPAAGTPSRPQSGAAPSPQTTAARPAADLPVRLGQLVEGGPGVIQPRLKTRPQPQYPMVARRLGREADVDVQVLVDENGAVIDATLRNEIGYGFDDAALRAARRTEFYPATKNNVRVKMWVALKISFKNE
jgi:TonB family protein